MNISVKYFPLFSFSIRFSFQYREVMERYCPWGKPGGGAPNDEIRIRNLEQDGFYPEKKNVIYVL